MYESLGLEAVDGDTPRERREALLSLPEEVFAERLVSLALRSRMEPDVLERVAATLSLPAAELVASPFAWRTSLLAAEMGVFSVQHELRGPLRRTDASSPPPSVRDPEHGEWNLDRLQVGKYESFRQDQPLVEYNPNHHAKWTPHELLHRVCGWFWRSDASGFEHYLGSRLNEIGPVLLWYGLDECLRLNSRPFDLRTSFSEPECTMDRVSWLTSPASELRARARAEVARIRAALRHFEDELEAIQTERGEGRIVAVPHEHLDSSSDAIAYVVAHRSRLTRPEFAACVSELHVEGHDYWATTDGYQQAIEEVVDRLLFGSLQAVDAPARRAGRVLRDWGERAADEIVSSRHPLHALLKEVGVELRGSLRGEETWSVEHWEERFEAVLGEARWARVRRIGGLGMIDEERLREGLTSSMPATVRYLDSSAAAGGWLVDFVACDHFSRRRRLSRRLVDYLVSSGASTMACNLARFEAALIAAGERSSSMERIADDKESSVWDAGTGELVSSEAFSVIELPENTLALHEALMEVDAFTEDLPNLAGEEAIPLLIGASRGEVLVVPITPAVRGLFESASERAVPMQAALAMLGRAQREESEVSIMSAEDWLDELIDSGAMHWVARR